MRNHYYTFAVAVCTLLITRLSYVQAGKGGYTYVQNTNTTSPVQARVEPMTVWYWCGFDSVMKQTASLSSSREVYIYEVSKSNVEDFPKTGKLCTVSLASRCEITTGGSLMKYNRCIAVRYGLSLTNKPAVFTVEVKQAVDGAVIVNIVGIVISVLTVIIGIFLVAFLLYVRWKRGKAMRPVSNMV